MNSKTKVMISLASAYAAGCIPCFDHYFMLAREEKIDDEEVQEIIAIARKVRNGADIALHKAITDVLDGCDEVGRMDDESHPCKCG